MLSAAVDCNVTVAAFITPFENSANWQLLQSLRTKQFRFISSLECIAEVARSLALDHVRKLHGKSQTEIDEFCAMLRGACELIDAPAITPPSLPRDATDSKFLDLARASNADYLVTNDRRHLLRLKEFGRTKIVTPHKFMLALRASQRHS